MTNWKLFFCLLAGILMESPLMSADSYEPQKKIGIEIETSWLKVKHGGERINFSIFNKNTKEQLWLLEPDTLDEYRPSEGEGLYNLELKTYLGFEGQDTFLPVLNTMTHVLKEIYGHKDNTFSIETLENFLPQDYDQHYHVKQLGHSMPIEKKLNGTIRPQITYQLPLSMIPKVFERLKELENESVLGFFNALNNDQFTESKSNRKPSRFSGINRLRANDKTGEILILLNKNFHILRKINKNVKGMSYLFLYYWTSLFNGKLMGYLGEPGLKKHLAVMSRIPLSQLYDHGLDDHEKTEFKEVMEKMVEQAGDQYKLREYTNDQGTKVTPTLTLKEWYFSIINHNQLKHRKTVKKRLNDKESIDHDVDSLSPPPGLNHSHSMGLFSWDATQSPLIEVRGYASIFEERFPVGEPKIAAKMVDDVNEFVATESKWFFNS